MNAPFCPFQPSMDPRAWWRATVNAWLEWSGLTFTRWCKATGVPVHVLESWRMLGRLPRNPAKVGALLDAWSGAPVSPSLERAKRAASVALSDTMRRAYLKSQGRVQKHTIRRKP